MTSVSGLSGERFEVVVVGGGLAGLATAASLCSQGCHSILVLESETVPGAHSSGKNAGLVRQVAEDPQTTGLCVRGADLIRRRHQQCPDLFRHSGSLIISDENHVPDSSWAQVEHRCLSEDEVRQHYPELRDDMDTRDLTRRQETSSRVVPSLSEHLEISHPIGERAPGTMRLDTEG